MFVFQGHGWTTTVNNLEQTFFAIYNNPGLWPKRVDITSYTGGGMIGINTLNIPNGQYKFVYMHHCRSGYVGGWPLAVSGAPHAIEAARNDMARAFGMYGWSESPQAYVGLWDYGYCEGDWLDFCASVNNPYGWIDLWARTPGRVLSYVIGTYPSSLSCPQVTKQANAPESWKDIQGQLRVFGQGGFGSNCGYYERDFSLF
jgi:hypothetical protein